MLKYLNVQFKFANKNHDSFINNKYEHSYFKYDSTKINNNDLIWKISH